MFVSAKWRFDVLRVSVKLIKADPGDSPAQFSLSLLWEAN